MTTYAGLDVSQSTTHLRVVKEGGAGVARGVVPTDPGALAAWLGEHAPGLERAVLEAGAMSSWLVAALRQLGVPTIRSCAARPKGALRHGPNKSAASAAEGLTRLARVGWVKPVHARARGP